MSDPTEIVQDNSDVDEESAEDLTEAESADEA
jgi:hypothetical protein